MTENIRREYDRWLKNADECRAQLENMTESEIKDAFYKNLEFGTGGLRGVLGAGTNRMNVYTVAAASQGLANYIIKTSPQNKSVAISYDSRINSDLFSKVAAGVFAANGIKVYIYPQLMPTPCLSFAVRKLKCAAGVMVTASHNPAKYNGYKVYGSDGCQITTVAAELILNEINAVDIFKDVRQIAFQSGICGGQIEFIPENVYDEFIENVKGQSVVKEEIDRSVAIIYSPLNGTGLKPVTRVLKESGFTNVTVVKEQELPDGNFTTCPYPNPEVKEALGLGLEYARKLNADIMLATDPDCDRVGIAVKDNSGDFRLLSGNETGLLLLDFICAMRTEQGTMPKNPVMVKTVVTSGLGDKIAADYGVETINVLTGFKFIGEQIGLLEKQGRESDYIFGFEESYGYLTGGYVRDKDGVDGAFMICEMFAYYKTKGISLVEKLDELYAKYGRFENTLESVAFEGADGFEKMQSIMDGYRRATQIEGKEIIEKTDFLDGINGLPKSNVIKFTFADENTMVVRPSGTEPKLKIYRSFKRQ